MPTYINDLRHDGQLERAVQRIGDVIVVMVTPRVSRVAHNVRGSREEVPVVFTDSWREGKMPCDVDRLERTPSELRRLVATYLPEG